MLKTRDLDALRFELMAAEYLQRMGSRMRERRDEMGFSRDHVAREMGGKTTGNQVYRWELGKHQPSPEALERLAQVLEVDVSYFYASEPEHGTADLMGALSATDNQPEWAQRLEGKVDELLGLAGRVEALEDALVEHRISLATAALDEDLDELTLAANERRRAQGGRPNGATAPPSARQSQPRRARTQRRA